MTISTSEDEPKEAIRREALRLGFDGVGVTAAHAPSLWRERLGAFIEEGRHGEMAFMERRVEERASPAALWPEARAVIMLGLNYAPSSDPLETLHQKEKGAISVYAHRRDYHDVMKPRLKMLARWIASRYGAGVKVFVDTAPLMEKPLAMAAGLGWQGKHTNLVSRRYGSWLFLGAVLTTLDLAADEAEGDHCGACSRCLDICPTSAFPAPYQLDARRCIAYLTIEHKGPIDEQFREAIGNRIFGCDDCLAVCPWNKFAVASREAKLALIDEGPPDLAALARLDDAGFRRRFAGTPIKRTGRDRFVRNVLIAIGNSEDHALIPVARERLGDASALVRGAAIWALSRLLASAAFIALMQDLPDDPETQDERRAALRRAAASESASGVGAAHPSMHEKR